MASTLGVKHVSERHLKSNTFYNELSSYYSFRIFILLNGTTIYLVAQLIKVHSFIYPTNICGMHQ